LGLSATDAISENDWAASQTSLPARAMPFLEKPFVSEACDFLRISTEVRSVLLDSLRMFREVVELRMLAWHFHRMLFLAPDPKRARLNVFPPIPAHVHEGAGMFYAIVCLSGWPHVQALHRKRNIPDSVTRDTLSDIELWIRAHHTQHDTWGFTAMNWLTNHLAGRLYQLGRLQFCLDSFGHDFHGYRHRDDGRVVLLAGNGMRFRADGQFDGADGVHDKAAAWTAEFCESDDSIRGHAIHPTGVASPKSTKLRRDDWQEVLRKGEPTLAVHIPASGPMDHAACGESMQRATMFFPAHFPERTHRIFTCESWLLDPQFDHHLPPASNIRRFLREWYLYPMPGANDNQTWERVFGRKYAKLEEAPQETALQRVIVRHARAGGRWRYGGGFILVTDLDWGAGVYRRKLTERHGLHENLR
jgi:hypothetical protein